MFISIILDNVGPYASKNVIDFRVNKKDKSNMDSICLLPDGVMVSKVAGIIAGNAYGKTTILDSLKSIGGFIHNPTVKKKVNNFSNEISDEQLKKLIYEFTGLHLIPVSYKSNKNATVSVEMYIESDDFYSGYYTYTIKYDKDYMTKGLIEESLSFRKKYNSKKIKQIFVIKDNLESEIGYKLAYKNNILNDLPEKAKKEFLIKMGYYECFYNKFLLQSSTIDAENYIFDEDFIINIFNKNNCILKKMINLIDSEILDVQIDETDDEEKKLYFVYNNYKLRYDSLSTATKKMCAIALNLYKASKNKGVFLLDEIDNSLNINVAKFIIGIYKQNIASYTSQIIFTTNNPDILDDFRRDQIFLIKKDLTGSYILKYLSFVDDKTKRKSRKDWSFSKVYSENIIINYPNEDVIEETYDYLKKQLL